jgi:hypothetical protein
MPVSKLPSASLAALAAQARMSGGIPQELPSSGVTGPEPDMAGALAALRSGQVSAGSLMQLLALLAGLGAGPQVGQGGQMPPMPGPGAAPAPSPVEAAFLGG